MFSDILRPKTLDEVIGNDHIKRALAGYFATGNLPHTILLDGKYGSGKTTLARIIASQLNVQNPQEHDCGANGDISYIRDIVDQSEYLPIWDQNKVIILDEVHKLSKAAQDVLLKTTEKPAEDTYFILCTSEPHKITPALKSRCVTFTVQPVGIEGIREAYVKVMKHGKLTLAGGKSDWDLVLSKSEGSLRVVYNLLDKMYAAADLQDNGTRILPTGVLESLLDITDEDIYTFSDTAPLPNAFLAGNLEAALAAVEASKREKREPMPTLTGLYNYLKKARLVEKRAALADIAILLADPEKANTWYAVEHIIFKHT